MNVVEINPSEVFSVTAYPRPHERFNPNGRTAQDPTVYEPIVFKCENCNYEIGFKEEDFKKHSRSKFSNLTQDEENIVGQFMQANNLKHFSFLDFYCPSCKRATSILFEDGYGGKHGDYVFEIKKVLMIK